MHLGVQEAATAAAEEAAKRAEIRQEAVIELAGTVLEPRELLQKAVDLIGEQMRASAVQELTQLVQYKCKRVQSCAGAHVLLSATMCAVHGHLQASSPLTCTHLQSSTPPPTARMLLLWRTLR